MNYYQKAKKNKMKKYQSHSIKRYEAKMFRQKLADCACIGFMGLATLFLGGSFVIGTALKMAGG
jgi:hypothetical protein